MHGVVDYVTGRAVDYVTVDYVTGRVYTQQSHNTPCQPPFDRLTPSLPMLNPAGVPLVGDPLDSKAAESVINTAVAQHGRVDGVVNCVGSIVLKSAHTTSDADFDQVRGSLGGGAPYLAEGEKCRDQHPHKTQGGRAAHIATSPFTATFPTTLMRTPEVLTTNLYTCLKILQPSVKAMMENVPAPSRKAVKPGRRIP